MDASYIYGSEQVTAATSPASLGTLTNKLVGEGWFGNRETGQKAENTYSKMYHVVLLVQAQLNGAEVVQTNEPCDRDNGIDRAENQSKEARAIEAAAEPSKESDYATEKMKDVVGGRKCEIEHFAAKEACDTNHDQDESAQDDIDSCEDRFHC
jgi:hypothetical protein